MKTEVRVVDDRVELLHNGQVIGTIEGTEGPGARIQSPHPMTADWHTDSGEEVKYVDIKIESGTETEESSPPEP